MSQDNSKVITFSFVSCAAIAYIVCSVLFRAFATSFGFINRFYSMEAVQHGLPVATAIIVFVILQFNSKINKWADEVVVEIKKVVWPSKNDTKAMTIVCCIMLVISGVILGLFDLTSLQFVQWLLQDALVSVFG